MSSQYYNRYNQFLIDGEQKTVPFVKLDTKPSDKTYIYKVGQSRMDKISQQFYGTPFFGWLIMANNPQFGGEEWNIPDGSILRVPFPLIASLQEYKNSIDNYYFYYGD
jgi:hypothetical protein